jgi:hypothetical protein
MALDTLLRLQAAENARPMQEVENLGKTLSGIIQSRGEKSLEQDALNVFGDGNIGMDRINTLREMHPNAPLQKIFTLASTIGTQSKAQKMKNLGQTVLSAYTTAKNEDRQLGPEDFKIMAEESGVDVQDVFKVMGSLVPWVKKTYEERNKEKDLYEVDYTGKETLVKPGEKEVKKPTYPSGYFKGKWEEFEGVGGKKYRRQVTGLDSDGNIIFGEAEDITKPDKPEKEDPGIPDTIYGPNGQTKKVFIKKGEEYVPQKGWSLKAPGEPDKPDKPERVAYRDTADGSIKYYDKNNATDRKTLERYGNQLVPLAENPIQNIIRQGVQGVAQSPASVQVAPKKYKTADEVRKDYKDGILDESEAAKILKKDFGYK